PARGPQAARDQRAVRNGGRDLIDFDAEVLEQRLLEEHLQPRPVRRVDDLHAGEVVRRGGQEGVLRAQCDTGDAAGGQRLVNAGANVGAVAVLEALQAVGDGVVGLRPGGAADPAGVEPGQAGLDVRGEDGRFQGEDADRIV